LTIDDDGNGATLVYDEAQRALTPGQICAFYDESENSTLLGGAVFASIEAN
jgi:tRNA-specific 2-thiouridylase